MAISVSKTYTGTGAQPDIDVSASHGITWGVTADGAGVDFDVEVQLTNGGQWFNPDNSVKNLGEAYTFHGGVISVRLNITNMGGAGNVNFEVLGDNR